MAFTEQTIRLATQLCDGTLECVICTETIVRRQPLWHCERCHGIQHLACMSYWAQNNASQGLKSDEFRCPLCQTASPQSSLVNRCFCGQVPDPESDLSLTPGTCGQTCNRRRPDPQCPHRCVAQCHPGPCPPCGAVREQECFCGVESRTVGCSSGEVRYSCGNECGKELACGRHYCAAPCHDGPCAPCAEVMTMKCYCGKQSKESPCAPEGQYGCGHACDKTLDCGLHHCTAKCHEGKCVPCIRTPQRQRTCACGKVAVWDMVPPVERQSCLDPLPLCGGPCGLPLPCGLHQCRAKCHDGPCPPCSEMVEFACRCGKGRSPHPCFVSYLPLPLRAGTSEWDEDNPDDFDKTPWLEACDATGVSRKALPKLFPPRCPRKCTAKKLCGKHACTRHCCGETDHICTNICHKRAPCGIHECGQLCHIGPCPPCDNYSPDPLFCRCRRSVVDPPVPCNTPPPRCNHPCIIPRPCGHPIGHTCHQGDCPPCQVAVPRTCGSHGDAWPYHLACSAPAPSCLKPCGKVCPGCLMSCKKQCHGGACPHNCSRKFVALGSAAA